MQLNVMVPWMHAYDHDLSCQLLFSALYRVSLAFCSFCRWVELLSLT